MSYERTREWRQNNPDKFEEQKYRYFSRNRANPQNVCNAGNPWTPNKIDAITVSKRPCDRELSGRMGRSIQAIQTRRSLVSKTM